MPSTLFSTPRPMPNRRLPIIGSGVVLALALPVFVVSGWSLNGWVLAAVLWLVVHGLDLLVARMGENAAIRTFALFFKSIGLLVVLFVAVATDRNVALAAVVTYALAYTFELGLSLVSYFGGTR